MNKMMEEPFLDRCPHCGGRADLEWGEHDIWVECQFCYAKGPAFGRGATDAPSRVGAMVKAIDGWNKRHVPSGESAEDIGKRIAERFFAEEC